MRRTLLWLLAIFMPLLCGSAADWPQFQANAARTGWTPDSPAPPFEPLYELDFFPEPAGLVQPILYGELMFIPTLHGRLYAINPRDGSRVWVREDVGTVARTPAAVDGLVLTANLEGFVLATRAADGGAAWSTELGAPISAAPCVDGGRCYIGTRPGDFFCLDASTGEILWRRNLGHYVWAGAAAADGKVYVATDGVIRLIALRAADGAELWRSPQLPGVFVRDWCPVVTAGKVIMRTLPSHHPPPEDFDIKPYFHWWAGHTREEFLSFYEELKAGRLPAAFDSANEEYARRLEADPWKQTMFIFDAETGRQPFVAAAFHMNPGWLLACAPPAVDSEGKLQVSVPFCGARFGRFDPARGRVCGILVGPLFKREYAPGEPQPPDVSPFYLGRYAEGGSEEARPDGLGGNDDEAHASSCGGDRVYWGHFSGIGRGARGFNQSLVYNIKTHQLDYLSVSKREPKGVSVSTLSLEGPFHSGMNDPTSSGAFTAPVPWRDLLIHHCAANERRMRIIVLRSASSEAARQ